MQGVAKIIVLAFGETNYLPLPDFPIFPTKRYFLFLFSARMNLVYGCFSPISYILFHYVSLGLSLVFFFLTVSITCLVALLKYILVMWPNQLRCLFSNFMLLTLFLVFLIFLLLFLSYLFSLLFFSDMSFLLLLIGLGVQCFTWI